MGACVIILNDFERRVVKVTLLVAHYGNSAAGQVHDSGQRLSDKLQRVLADARIPKEQFATIENEST